MHRPHRLTLLAPLASAATLGSSLAQNTVLFSDAFESNSSSSYTVVDDGFPDGTQSFAHDYSIDGIPPAPRSTGGTTRGLKLTANDVQGNADAWTLFHNTPVTSDRYIVVVDVWMNYGTFGPSTEHAHVGVGGDGTTFNSIASPISGSGMVMAFDGDGDHSTLDYALYRDASATPMGLASGVLQPTDPAYLGNGTSNFSPFFQALFPSPPATRPGAPGNIWTTLELEVDNLAGTFTVRFDGALTYEADFVGRLDGRVSIGLVDIFSSVSGTANVFTVYDNLSVEELPMGLGTNYCSPVANSTGSAGELSAAGSNVVMNDNVTLTAAQLPLNSFGFFLTSRSQGSVMQPGGSQGVLCLSGSIGRYVGPGQIQNSAAAGSFDLALSLTQTPTPTGLVAVAAGETWNFQSWYRDSVGGAATSNFTDGLSITFQ